MFKRIFLALCLLVLCITVSSGGITDKLKAVIARKSVAVGGASPDWAYGFEDPPDNADCNNAFDAINGSPVCNDTTHPSEGTYNLKLADAGTRYVRKNFSASQTDVWIYFAYYIDVADIGDGQRFHLKIYSATGPIATFNTKNTDRYSWYNYGDTTYYDGSNNTAGQVLVEFRLYVKIDGSSGALKLAKNQAAGGWTTEVNQTSLDTQIGADTDLTYVHWGDGTMDGDYYMDDFEIYYSDPGWGW